MIIEDKSTYAYQLRHLANPSFDKIRNLAKDFIMKLPEQLKDELYEEIERGEKQLETEPELMYYLHAFGKMHKAKLNYAFEHLPGTFFEIPEINIIDYGCGQAVATLCYADFLRKQGYKQKIRRVTLIEPSEAALKRAALHVSVFFPDAEIVTINKGFDDLETKDIVCDEDVPTLHLLSNVLDLECFSLAAFMRLLNKTIGPSNMFICVGPYFGEESDRSKRMDWFNENLMDDGYFVDDLDAGEFNENYSWTCMVRCFGVGDLDNSFSDKKISTKVTNKDIGNGIKDEYGVLYSKDGKRLVSAENCDCKTYTIKKGVKVICDKAFYLCKSIQSISIPNSVISIGNGAFVGCHSLQSIVIPESVTSIGANPFVYSGIRSIVSHSRSFIVDGKALYNQKKNLLIAFYLHNTRFVIPKSVTNIGDSAFSGCVSRKSVVIPNSVTSIGNGAFEGCKSLQSIAIPNSVRSIGNFAFYDCTSLQSIIIPESVTSIGNGAFVGCHSLQSIVIPESVTSIGANPFVDSGVRSIVSHSKYFTVDRKALYDQKKKLLIACFSKGYHFVIPDNVTSIGDSAFSNCKSLQSIVIPNSVKSIGDYVFEGCHSLQSLVIPNSVKSIGSLSFRGNGSLRKIVIPDIVTNIADIMFSDCHSLQSFAIPNSVKSIGNFAFQGCGSLRSINIPNSVTSIGNWAFSLCTSLRLIVIPNNVRDIGEMAFSFCKSLQSIVIPNSVTDIGERPFSFCESLKSIVIPKGSRAKFKKMLDEELWDKLVEK